MDKTLELRQKGAALVKEGRDLIDKVDGEKRTLTADEETRYEKIMADVDKMGADINREER
ncbi:MAG TPA: hypothetical protein VIK34_02620 [Clostridiaceae bacterium]